jgi:hypothetical protein
MTSEEKHREEESRNFHQTHLENELRREREGTLQLSQPEVADLVAALDYYLMRAIMVSERRQRLKDLILPLKRLIEKP